MSGIGWAMREHNRWLRKQSIRLVVAMAIVSFILFLSGLHGFFAFLVFCFGSLIGTIVVMFWSI